MSNENASLAAMLLARLTSVATETCNNGALRGLAELAPLRHELGHQAEQLAKYPGARFNPAVLVPRPVNWDDHEEVMRPLMNITHVRLAAFVAGLLLGVFDDNAEHAAEEVQRMLKAFG